MSYFRHPDPYLNCCFTCDGCKEVINPRLVLLWGCWLHMSGSAILHLSELYHCYRAACSTTMELSFEWNPDSLGSFSSSIPFLLGVSTKSPASVTHRAKFEKPQSQEHYSRCNCSSVNIAGFMIDSDEMNVRMEVHGLSLLKLWSFVAIDDSHG